MYVIVTRYVRANGRVIVHAYGGPDGSYPTRSKAVAANRRQLAEMRNFGRPDDHQSIETHVVKVLAL